MPSAPSSSAPQHCRQRLGVQLPTHGERRTFVVIALTLVMMTVEIGAGLAFGSMALLADGWHMGTHAAALGITAFAYIYARRHSLSERYSFGTGKVGALGGFASAVTLGVVALFVLGESLHRLIQPVEIHFTEAITVAFVGLAVNLLSALLLQDTDGHTGGDGHFHHHDHNLRAAYLHVLADALTSILAIAALSSGRLLGWTKMDPAMGVVGALVIARWAYGLLGETSRVLLDAEAGEKQAAAIRELLEHDGGTHVTDLHVWRIGRCELAAVVAVEALDPKDPEVYKALLKSRPDLVHITVEVHRLGREPLQK